MSCLSIAVASACALSLCISGCEAGPRSLPDGGRSPVADTGAASPEGGAPDAAGRPDGGGTVPPDACVPACALGRCGPDGCAGSCGTCATGLTCVARRCTATPPALPRLHDHSGASAARVEVLVREAIEGLGFAPGAPDGPNAGDRFFVGRHYMAWIDQTGFYGKINGLWVLNAAAGEALDFVLRAADGRPVSMLVVGENGAGRWAPGYMGAEHIEFPSRTPEPDDDPACATGDWCNQYSMNEAATFTDPDIPHWSACNAGSVAFTERFDPIIEEESGDDLRLVYEGRLVKEADLRGRSAGCHEDWLFPDGVRRPVYLRLGLELHGDADYLDRLLQVRNPAGNPAFDGPMSFIGGFVLTAWPGAHPLKRFDRFLRPELRPIADTFHGGGTLAAGAWNAHPFAPGTSDEIFAWLDQPISLATTDAPYAGQRVTLAHVGPSDNADVGICFCYVHGGIEMGGGLIHGGMSLPVMPGALSIEARRRITFGGAAPPVLGGTFVYEAETDLAHGSVGRADADGWSANTAADASGHMAFGPYATDWGGGSADVTFRLMVDDNSADDLVVVALDVYDATVDEVLARREVRRRDLAAPMTYQDFTVSVSLAGRLGHRMETRVDWRDVSYVRLDRVTVVAR